MIERKIRIALAGIGNIASGVLQGIEYIKAYENKKDFLLHPTILGYEVKDIAIVAAFDVDTSKIGKDITEAIFAPINSTPKFVEIDNYGVSVCKGPVLDGLSDTLREVIQIAREKYGLTTPEQDLGEIGEWAKHISITELAREHNFTHCKKCGY